MSNNGSILVFISLLNIYIRFIMKGDRRVWGGVMGIGKRWKGEGELIKVNYVWKCYNEI